MNQSRNMLLTLKTTSALILSILLVAGCEKTARQKPRSGRWVPTMENPPIKEVPICAEKGLQELKEEDILVSVNGIALTKGDLQLALKRFWWDLTTRQPNAKPDALQKTYRQFGRRYIKDFIDTQLFVYEARKLHLLDERSLRKQVDRGVEGVARNYRATPKMLDARMPGGLGALRRSLEDIVWSTAYIESNVTAKVATDSMVSNVLIEIEQENKAIAATNQATIALLKDLRSRVVEKGEDFGMIAKTYSMDDNFTTNTTGYWTSYCTNMEIPPTIKDKILTLDVGGVSEVLEDEEGYYFAKILKKRLIFQATNDVSNTVWEYDLGRVFKLKEEPVILAVKGDLKAHIQKQFQDEANTKRAEELLKNAVVVFPYGTNLLGKVSSLGKKTVKGKKKPLTLKTANQVKKMVESGASSAEIKKIGKAHKDKKGKNREKNKKKPVKSVTSVGVSTKNEVMK